MTKPRGADNTTRLLTNQLFMRNNIMADSDLTAETLRSLLRYDSTTGLFSWRDFGMNPNRRTKFVSDRSPRYSNITISGKVYRAHRLAWLYHYGVWPETFLDHINGRKSDNRITNLREASNAENQQNRKLNKNSKSGLTGVCYDKAAYNWKARINIGGTSKNLGKFPTKELAHEAYLAAKQQLHTFNPIQTR